MPLEEMSGFVVGVTADRRADEQIAMLERRGAAVIHGPAIHHLGVREELFPGWREPADIVRLVSERGAVDRIRVRVTRTVRAGEVFVPFHLDEQCANRLTKLRWQGVAGLAGGSPRYDRSTWVTNR